MTKRLTDTYMYPNLKDPDIIGYVPGGGTSTQFKINAWREALTAADIPYTLCERNFGTEAKPYLIPTGVEIHGQDAIRKYREQGGVLLTENVLRGVAFQRKPGANEIYCDSHPDTNAMFDQLGLHYEVDRGVVHISHPLSLAAAAIAGATFNGSSEAITNMGFRHR